MGGVRVVAAIDKFRGTATAAEVPPRCVARRRVPAPSAMRVRWPTAARAPSTRSGGPNRRTTVMGPLGDQVDAEWRLTKRTAVIEMAAASGLALVGGPEGNDPVAASTHGTGELIAAAVEAGANRIIVGVGGSATTDGGFGRVLRAMFPPARLRGIEMVVACDVRTLFVDAAAVFGPQKGATPRRSVAASSSRAPRGDLPRGLRRRRA